MIKMLAVCFLVFQSSIYDIHFKTFDGVDYGFDKFKGKKILIVNASNKSRFSDQYQTLNKLQTKYIDNLVIIVFPSGDFSGQILSDSDIKRISDSLNITYIVGTTISVLGKNISPIYQWLSSYSLNGSIENPPNGDFFKYLIDKNGDVEGVYSGVVDPMDSLLQQAIVN